MVKLIIFFIQKLIGKCIVGIYAFVNAFNTFQGFFCFTAFDSYQQLGPLARLVEDMATILPIISGPDFRDAAVVPAPLGDPSKVDLKSLRIAFYVDNKVIAPTTE